MLVLKQFIFFPEPFAIFIDQSITTPVSRFVNGSSDTDESWVWLTGAVFNSATESEIGETPLSKAELAHWKSRDKSPPILLGTQF